LWAFNEEVLARAIFDSKIPIISAVGHEIDVTVADLVADARASTPTKAGVVAVPDVQEVLGDLANKKSRLKSNIKARLGLCEENLQTILASAVFRKPLLLVHNAQQQVDGLAVELTEAIKELLVEARDKLHKGYEQVVKIEPHRLLGKKTVYLNDLRNRAKVAINVVINGRQMQLTAQANRLVALNPKSVLRRGYSITTNKQTGLIIRALKDVEVGNLLTTELAGENLIESRVTKK
jgi:exodeoxyribonuclease VII large subunit